MRALPVTAALAGMRAPPANQKQLVDSHKERRANQSHGCFWGLCSRNEAELTHHSRLIHQAKHYHLLMIIFLAETGKNCYKYCYKNCYKYTISGTRTKPVGEVGDSTRPAHTRACTLMVFFSFFYFKVLRLALADTPMNSATSFPLPVIALNLLRLASSRGDCSCLRLPAALTKGTG